MRGSRFTAVVIVLLSACAIANAQSRASPEPVYEYVESVESPPAAQGWWQRAERYGSAGLRLAEREWPGLLRPVRDAGVVRPVSIAAAVLFAIALRRARRRARSAQALAHETAQTASAELKLAHAIRADAERKLARAEALQREAAQTMRAAEVLVRQAQSAPSAPPAPQPADDDKLPAAGETLALSALKSNAPRSTSDAAMLAGGSRDRALRVSINDLLRGR